MYESTMETLMALYDRVSTGGFVIVDDYACVPGCRAAVDDFVITGPKTNLPFLAELLDDDGFRRGSYDTSVIGRLRS